MKQNPENYAPAHGAEIDPLTGLRGFAALWVLLFHVWGAAIPRRMTLDVAGWSLDFTPLFSIGWAGVQIFFVLSGFLLSLPYLEWHAGRSLRPRTLPYLVRRCTRVLPAYYLQLAILLAGGWWLQQYWPIAGLGDLLGYLAMLILPEPWGVPAINRVWWTLPIEFSFYLVLPLLAVLLARPWLWLLVALSACVMPLWRWYVIADLAVDQPPGSRVGLGYQLPGSLDSFVIGMVAAWCYQAEAVRGWLVARRWRQESLAALGAMMGLVLMYWMHYTYRAYWTPAPITFLWTPLFSLAAAAIVLAAACGSAVLGRLFANRMMLYLGTISYGIYLWHFPLISWLQKLPLSGEGYALPWLLPACAAVAALVAALSWHGIERPAIAWVRNRLRGAARNPASRRAIS